MLTKFIINLTREKNNGIISEFGPSSSSRGTKTPIFVIIAQSYDVFGDQKKDTWASIFKLLTISPIIVFLIYE